MRRFSLLFIFLFTFLIRSGLYGIGSSDSVSVRIDIIEQDSLKERQILYNGRVWRNLYYRVRGDQFLFSKDFLQGSLTINGNSYKNILINYDIYNDEILTPKKNGSIIQLNKEMVDSFTLVFVGKTYRFVNAQEDSLPVIKGFVKVLYKGKSALYVKYKKEIEALAVED
ncbi:MAG: hypothetical protein NTV31_17420, partial [Bacteroidia bacterium]|nr:hypothetical protein [Bacteroidia bacterium]